MNITDKELIEKCKDEMPGWDIHISGIDLINELIKRFEEITEEKRELFKEAEGIMTRLCPSGEDPSFEHLYAVLENLANINPQTDGE